LLVAGCKVYKICFKKISCLKSDIWHLGSWFLNLKSIIHHSLAKQNSLLIIQFPKAFPLTAKTLRQE